MTRLCVSVAIAWRRIVKGVGGDDAACAWHVLHKKSGIADDVTSPIAGDQSRPCVIIAARGRTHQHANLPVTIEHLGLVGISQGVARKRGKQAEKSCDDRLAFHLHLTRTEAVFKWHE